MTTYFRHTFEAPPLDAEDQLVGYFRVDDGCLVHLNDKEVGRFNLPRFRVRHDTPASADLSGFQEQVYSRIVIPAKLLKEGVNVLTVEVHQSSLASDDLWFEFELTALGEANPYRPRMKVAAEPSTKAYHQNHYVDAKTRIADGYADGGRRMRLDASGLARSGREVIVVDRQRDAGLRQSLAYASSPELQALSAMDRATRIARHIDQLMSPPEGRDHAVYASMRLHRQYSGQEILLGEVSRLCGGGVCRHRSLLFKLMADEAGLKNSLVRGNYGHGQSIGGHAWNELHLEDGTTRIVDVMNPQPDFYFPSSDERSVRYYLDITGKPLYKIK